MSELDKCLCGPFKGKHFPERDDIGSPSTDHNASILWKILGQSRKAEVRADVGGNVDKSYSTARARPHMHGHFAPKISKVSIFITF